MRLSMGDTLGIGMHSPSLTYNAPLINLVTHSFTTQLLLLVGAFVWICICPSPLKLQPHF